MITRMITRKFHSLKIHKFSQVSADNLQIKKFTICIHKIKIFKILTLKSCLDQLLPKIIRTNLNLIFPNSSNRSSIQVIICIKIKCLINTLCITNSSSIGKDKSLSLPPNSSLIQILWFTKRRILISKMLMARPTWERTKYSTARLHQFQGIVRGEGT